MVISRVSLTGMKPCWGARREHSFSDAGRELFVPKINCTWSRYAIDPSPNAVDHRRLERVENINDPQTLHYSSYRQIVHK